MKKQIQRITTKGIFHYNDKILFVQDKKGKWELPGGRIEFNETPHKALKRECEEELGWKDINIGNIIYSWSFNSNTEKVDKHFIVLVYECFSDRREIDLEKLNSEQIDYIWVKPSELNKLNVRKGYRESIDKYLHSRK